MKLFAVYPGEVISKNDWDRHYINATQLMDLYGVRSDECVVIDFERPELSYGQDLEGLMVLTPLAGVDYRPVSDSERQGLIDRLSARV